jgi:hypothetical protein
MPCIKILGSIKIYIYARDHNPPHFHAISAEDEELISIHDLSSLIGSLSTKDRKIVLDWAKENKEYLMGEWEKIN